MEILSAKRSFANESEGAGMAGCLGHNGAVLAWFKTEQKMEQCAKLLNLEVVTEPGDIWRRI